MSGRRYDYTVHTVADDPALLQARLAEVGRLGGRVVSVVYRPAIEAGTTAPGSFVVTAEHPDDLHRLPPDDDEY